MGDLVLTCTGSLSRNRAVGVAVGQGATLEQALAGKETVAEGVDDHARARCALAAREGVEMPIVAMVHRVLFDGLSRARRGGRADDARAARGAGRMSRRAEPVQEFFSIGEVCELTDLKPHVLRYWESQFRFLNPAKNRSGNRVYQRREIELILLVKHLLYTEKYTIEGARQKVDEHRKGGELQVAARGALDGADPRGARARAPGARATCSRPTSRS